MQRKLVFKKCFYFYLATYEKYNYIIEYGNRTFRLYITIDGVQNHVTGGMSQYRIEKLAEKDLQRRVNLKSH